MKFIPMMIWMAWLSLKRDWVALMLTFALPIVFFSIFVGIFGGVMTGGGDGTNSVKVAVVDDDQSESSKRFIAALMGEGGLRVRNAPADRADKPYSRAEVETQIKDGNASVGLVIPKGFGETFPSFNFGGGDEDQAGTIELLTDKQRDPVGHQMVAGLMQKAAMMGAPDLMIERGLEQFDKFAGGMTQQQRAAMDRFLPMLRAQTSTTQPATQPSGGTGQTASGAGFGGLVKIKVVSVQGDHESDWAAFVSFQVAQTAVMFLLFSMAGAAGSLLEEQENGTLERVLSSNVGMTGLLMGKWFIIALIGVLQLAIMFLWAWMVFGLKLFTAHHLAGFLIMTIVTAAAGSAFGMLLATACRTRGQLAGISTIVILMMSALGGSMFPRFMMSDTLQTIGLGTFNGWALDGYRKVFYDQLPLWQLWPQVLVLVGLTILFMFIARQLARRWESM